MAILNKDDSNIVEGVLLPYQKILRADISNKNVNINIASKASKDNKELSTVNIKLTEDHREVLFNKLITECYNFLKENKYLQGEDV